MHVLPATPGAYRRRRGEAAKGTGTYARAYNVRSRGESLYGEDVEGARRRRTADGSLGKGMASRTGQSVITLLNVFARGRLAEPVAGGQDYPTKKAGKERLQRSQSLAANIASLYSGQNLKGGGGRKNLVYNRDV